MHGSKLLRDSSPAYLTTKAAQKRLYDRGVLMDLGTIIQWCAAGKFEGARRTGQDKRSPWVIPTASVDATDFIGDEQTIKRAQRELLLRDFVASDGAFDPNFDKARAQIEIEAYRQPWARAYLTAVRDGDVLGACARAGVDDETVLAEIRENKAFATRITRLWSRRCEFANEIPLPLPIATPSEIQEEVAQLSAAARALFERARETGYLVIPPGAPAAWELRNQWYLWCETHGLPFVCQKRGDRWYAEIDLDVHELYEADGCPRRLPDALLVEAPDIARRHIGFSDRMRRGSPDAILWSYFPAENAEGVAAELYALYRRYYPTDPAPNPEVFGQVPLLPAAAYPLTPRHEERRHVAMAEYYINGPTVHVSSNESRYKLRFPLDIPVVIDPAARENDDPVDTFVHPHLRTAYAHAAFILDVLHPAGDARFNDYHAVTAVAGVTGVGLSTLGRLLAQGLRVHTRSQNLPLALPVLRVALKPAQGKHRLFRAYAWSVARSLRDAFSREGIERSHPTYGDLRTQLDRVVADLKRGATVNYDRLMSTTLDTIREVGVPVVIVDDVDVWAAESERAADLLLSIIHASHTPHLLLANLPALPIIHSFRKAFQINPFLPYQRDDPEEAQAFADALQWAMARLPLPVRANAPSSLEFYHERASGCVGTLVRWLAAAVALARAEGADALAYVHLERAAPSEELRQQRASETAALAELG